MWKEIPTNRCIYQYCYLFVKGRLDRLKKNKLFLLCNLDIQTYNKAKEVQLYFSHLYGTRKPIKVLLSTIAGNCCKCCKEPRKLREGKEV